MKAADPRGFAVYQLVILSFNCINTLYNIYLCFSKNFILYEEATVVYAVFIIFPFLLLWARYQKSTYEQIIAPFQNEDIQVRRKRSPYIISFVLLSFVFSVASTIIARKTVMQYKSIKEAEFDRFRNMQSQ
jgi:hypothetical protein